MTFYKMNYNITYIFSSLKEYLELKLIICWALAVQSWDKGST